MTARTHYTARDGDLTTRFTVRYDTLADAQRLAERLRTAPGVTCIYVTQPHTDTHATMLDAVCERMAGRDREPGV